MALLPALAGRYAQASLTRLRSGLAVANLGISFGGVKAVQDVSFEAAPGQVTSLIGPNGAGKTTVLNMLGGFYRPQTGTIRLGGVEVQGLPAWRIARAGVARTYQTTQLFGSMSVAKSTIAARREVSSPGSSVTKCSAGQSARR